MQKYFYAVIALSLLISGCASQKTRSTHQSPPITEDLLLGTWESKPTGATKAVTKITFLPKGKCLITASVHGKITNNKDKGTYTLMQDHAIIHARMVNTTSKQKNNYTLDTDKVTPVENGNALDFTFLHTTYWDKNGKQIDIDAAPNFGVYRLYRVQSK